MIQLNDRYALGFDTLNIILYKVNVRGEESKNPGEIVREPIGYYSDFETLAKSLVLKEICSEEYGSLEEIIKKIDDFKQDISNNIKKVAD